MNVMHILATAGTGGIESLCRDYSRYSKNNNIFVVLWGKNGAAANAMRQAGSVIIEFNSQKRDALNIFIKLFRLVKQYSIDVVIVHHAAPVIHIYMYLLGLKFPGLKTIAYAHGVAEDMCRHNDLRGLKIRKKVLSTSLKKSTAVVAISNKVKESLVSYFGVPAGKIAVIYNGTDTSSFSPDIKSGIHDPVRLIFVGRLVKEKGVQTTLQALNQLPKVYNWKFDIVGDGPYRKDLEKQVKLLDLTDRVHFCGNRKDIPELLRKHDIFIHMPEWEEGFGITVIEAMATGVICICKAKGGIPEIISNGVDGILLYSNKELTEVLKKIISGTDKYSIVKIRENAIIKAQRFSIAVFAEKLDDLIANINFT